MTVSFVIISLFSFKSQILDIAIEHFKTAKLDTTKFKLAIRKPLLTVI